MTSRSAREALPWCILVALLTGQAILVITAPPRPLGGDEIDYVRKAEAIATEGTLPRATPNDPSVEAGAWDVSDWRPPGYPLFVVALSGGSFDSLSLRPRVAAVQFAAMAGAILLAFSMLRTSSLAMQVAAAIVLGIAPWPFAFVTLIGPDSLNASLSFFGLFLLARSTSAASGRWVLFIGSLLLSSTLLLRPEMVAVAPVPIAACLLIRNGKTGRRARDWVLAGTAFLIVVAAQYGYRTYFTGKLVTSLFSGFHIYDAGAFRWASSWIGTEDEAYDFVYGLSYGDSAAELPARAFANEQERLIVQDLRARVRATGFDAQVDRGFDELARKRVREHPITAGVLPRIWHAIHLWINNETNDQVLQALKPIPRTLRRTLLGLLLLLKVLLVCAFSFRVLTSRKKWASAPSIAVLGSFVITRTILVGLVLNSMVYRHMVAAWLPLMVVVFVSAPDLERRLGACAAENLPTGDNPERGLAD